MLATEIINNNIPRLKLQDTAAKALQLLQDYKATHLPVVSEDNYLGLISEEDLLDAENSSVTLQALQHCFRPVSVKRTSTSSMRSISAMPKKQASSPSLPNNASSWGASPPPT